jgi:hypothetical protein
VESSPASSPIHPLKTGTGSSSSDTQAPFQYAGAMTIALRVTASLEQAWQMHTAQVEPSTAIPDEVQAAVRVILNTDSGPNRQILLTIAAATAENPDSNPAAIQLPAGVDRRGQAKIPRDALSAFKDAKGLTLKISKDPGVSNQWREEEINAAWVQGRKNHDRPWALAFLSIVSWLRDASDSALRSQRSQELLEYVSGYLVQRAASNALNYPRFRAGPRLSMTLVRTFLQLAPNRPDALEAVVAVAARVLAAAIDPSVTVYRGDVNSPDPIDILMTSDTTGIKSGIEVTDDPIDLAKLEHEVLPAMLHHGLDRAIVVSRGVKADESDQIDAWIDKIFANFGQRIDLADVDDIESWLLFPATRATLSTEFLWEIGAELDRYSTDPNRRAWYATLSDYIEANAQL